MMGDVDSFTRRYGTSIAAHCAIAQLLSTFDKSKRPKSYDKSLFVSLLRKKEAAIPATLHIITDLHISVTKVPNPSSLDSKSNFTLTTAPLLIASRSLTPEKETRTRAFEAPSSLVREIISIDDIFSTTNNWSKASKFSTCIWHNLKYSTSNENLKIASQLDNTTQSTMLPFDSLASFYASKTHSNITFIDWTIPFRWNSITQHSHNIRHCVSIWTHSILSLRLILLWIPCNRYQSVSPDTISKTLQLDLPYQWRMDSTVSNSTDFGDPIELRRILVTISLDESLLANFKPITPEPSSILDSIHTIDATNVHEDLQFPSSILLDQGNACLYRARPVAILTPQGKDNLSNLQSNNLILDLMFPGLEPSDNSVRNSVFGCRYGLAIETPSFVNVHTISSIELLSLFSKLPYQSKLKDFDDTVVNLVTKFSTPHLMKHELLTFVTNESSFAEDIYFANQMLFYKWATRVNQMEPRV